MSDRTVVAVKRFLVALVIIAIPSAVWAVSLYDIVRLSKAKYSDEQIIAMIRDTDSRFEIDADTIVGLKSQGVSERVIQAVVAARVDNGESERSPRGDERSNEVASPSQQPEPPAAHQDISVVTPRPHPAAAPRFGTWEYNEEGGMAEGGHHGHQHYAVAVGEIPLLIVRSEGARESVAERAAGIAKNLNDAVTRPDGEFYAARAAVWYRSGSAPPIRVIEVTRGDVIAYQRRSVGSVTPARLGAYWAALLNDYVGLFIFGREPHALSNLHLGETLEKLFQSSNGESDRTQERVVDHLTADDKDHLIELATRVPAEFRAPR